MINFFFFCSKFVPNNYRDVIMIFIVRESFTIICYKNIWIIKKYLQLCSFYIIEIFPHFYRLLKLCIFMRSTKTHAHTHIYFGIVIAIGIVTIVRIALTHRQESSYQSVQSSKWRWQWDQSSLSMKQLYTTLRPSRFHLAFTIALQSIRAQLPFTYRSTSAVVVSAKCMSLKSTIHTKMPLEPSETYLHPLFLYAYFLSLLLNKNVF